MVSFGLGAVRPVGQFGTIAIAEGGEVSVRRRKVAPRFRRTVRALNAPQRRVLAAVRKLGAPLASATSPDELSELIDRAVSSPEFPRMMATMASLFDLNAVLSEPLDEVAAALTPLFGEEAAAAIERGMRDEVAALGGWLNLVASLPVDQARAARERFRNGGDHLHLLYGQDLPLTICEAILGAYRAQAAIAGVNLALVTGRPLVPSVAAMLAQIYAAGMRLYARFIASIREARVSVEAVPLDERYDIEALLRVHNEFWQGIESGAVALGSPDAD